MAHMRVKFMTVLAVSFKERRLRMQGCRVGKTRYVGFSCPDGLAVTVGAGYPSTSS